MGLRIKPQTGKIESLDDVNIALPVLLRERIFLALIGKDLSPLRKKLALTAGRAYVKTQKIHQYASLIISCISICFIKLYYYKRKIFLFILEFFATL